MKLFTKNIHDKLLANGRKQDDVRGTADEIDFRPVVKLFTPDGGCTWLLTELDSQDPDIAFGLCDLGVGFPELGSVRKSELETGRGLIGLPIERDKFFKASHPLSIYASAARHARRIVTDAKALERAAVTFAAAYAYPTSPIADELNRHHEGCFYVQRVNGIKPPKLETGPFETREQAEAHAGTLN